MGKKSKILMLVLVIILFIPACQNTVLPDSPPADAASEAAGETAKDNVTEDVIAEKEVIAYVQPEMKGEITVNVYESSEWLQTAAQMFVERYPDMKVVIHEFYQGKDVLIYSGDSVEGTGTRPTGQTREDYIAQLNTQLLSGKADDIIITSIGLPIGRYIKMGVFEDLSSYLAGTAEINQDNYYMNVFDACRTAGGALYQFPISVCAIPTVRFDAELIENTGIGPKPGTASITWREALDIGKQMYDASTLPNTYMNSAWSIVGDIFTKTAIASINYDTGAVEINREKMLEILAVFDELAEYEEMPEDFDFYTYEFHVPYAIQYTPDVDAAVEMTCVSGNPTMQWSYEDGNVYLSPYYALDFGITSQSKNKELAWEFLKFLVTEEVQTLPSCPWSGVNKKGLQSRVEGVMASGEYSQEDIRGVWEVLDGWVSQIQAYRTEDTELIHIAEGAFREFTDGTSTAEETIDNLIRRLEQYMNE